jgi:cytochrome oxidase Cu insertion factor (SCO1/SenC/PrrC family)
MKRLSTGFAAVVLGGTLLTAARPQQTFRQSRQSIDVAKLGPQVGERVPDFSLTDQNGKSWTLPSILGSSGAMLVFFRSADW